MDLNELVVPFVWWTSVPQHRISCASSLAAGAGECTSHLVTGSATGEIVLWRRYTPNLTSPRVAARADGSFTAIEKNIQSQIAEMFDTVSGAERFMASAIVLGRKQSDIALSAIEIFQFQATALFAACYVDGLICIHECLSGDNILSLPILSISVSKIRIYQNSQVDPFVMAACIPQRISTQIFIVRIGLGEGYHGIMSIVKTLDLEVPVIDAEIHLKSKVLFILTRMQLLTFSLQSMDVPQTALDLTDIAAPLSVTISGQNAVVFGKNYYLTLTVNDEGEIIVKHDLQYRETELDTGILFNNGSTIAVVHKNNVSVDLIDILTFEVIRSIQLPVTRSRCCQPNISVHPITLASLGAGLIICGGDNLPDGSVFEVASVSSTEANVWSLTDVFPHLAVGDFKITASIIIGLMIPVFVAGFDSGLIRLLFLSSKYPVMQWKAHVTAITALSFIKSVLFSGSSDGEVSAWKLDESPSCIAKFDVHFNAVLRFVQINDTEIAAISQDQSFSLYEVRSPSYVFKRLIGIGHSSPIVSFLYSSWVKDSGFVISVSQDASIYVWIAATGALDRILKGKIAREFLRTHGFTADNSDTACFSGSKSVFKELPNIGVTLNAKVCTLNLASMLDVLSAQVMASKKPESDLGKVVLEKSGSDSCLEPAEICQNGLRLITSLFIDWTLDPELERQIKERYDLFDPMQLIDKDLFSYLCFAMFGIASVFKDPRAHHPFSVTLLLPSRWPSTSRWRFSHRCTALNSLCVNAICMRLMSTGSTVDQSLCSRLLANYGVFLPDALLLFKEPALRVLSAFSLHRIEAIHVSARLLLQSAITRMSQQTKASAFEYWSSVFKGHVIRTDAQSEDRDYEHDGSHSKLEFLSRKDEKLMCAMILSFLCVNHRFALDADIGSSLCMLLIQLITEKSSESVSASLAADLIGKSARQWQTFLLPLDRIIFQLLSLSANERGDIAACVQLSARRALLELSALKPADFFVVTARVLHSVKKSSEKLSITALECAADLVMKSPSSLLLGQDEKLIPATLKMIINRLNPQESSVRKSIVQSAVLVLKAFASKYPNVKMHPELQVLAFGSDNDIVMYDVLAAAKWRTLEGHIAPVNAIAFNANGSLLASYYAKDNPPSLRIWSLSGSNRSFMSHWLNTPSQSFRVIELPSLQSEFTDPESLQRINLTWTSLGIQLTREDRSIHQLNVEFV